jgi:hypothetical protein
LFSIGSDHRLELALLDAFDRPDHPELTLGHRRRFWNALLHWGVMLLVALEDVGDER